MAGTNPLFVDPSAGELGFRLKPGSPAINAGAEITGITEGFKGKAPDLGAYEYGGTAWRAGVLSKPGPILSKP